MNIDSNLQCTLAAQIVNYYTFFHLIVLTMSAIVTYIVSFELSFELH